MGPFDEVEYHPDDDVLLEQDNQFIADRWIEAEDYEWET